MGFGVSYLRPYNFETFTVGQAVTTLDEVIYNDTENAAGYAARQPAMEAVISTENASIRFRTDGGDPDGTTGHLAAAGAYLTITGYTAIKNFKAYTPSGTATLTVTYYNG
jgi:hypothetical protein